MEKKLCSRCRYEKGEDSFVYGLKNCDKCTDQKRDYNKRTVDKRKEYRKQYLEANREEINQKRREKTANNGYLYCHVCERRVNPEIWDFHLVGGCHQDNILKHLKADYERLVEEAPTQEFKDKYFQEGQERIQELKMTMPLYNPALRRKKVDQADGDKLD